MKPDQERVRNLLTDTVTLLCKNGLIFKEELRIEGLLGVTVDNKESFYVHIGDTFGPSGDKLDRDPVTGDTMKEKEKERPKKKYRGDDSPSHPGASPKSTPSRPSSVSSVSAASSPAQFKVKSEPEDDVSTTDSKGWKRGLQGNDGEPPTKRRLGDSGGNSGDGMGFGLGHGHGHGQMMAGHNNQNPWQDLAAQVSTGPQLGSADIQMAIDSLPGTSQWSSPGGSGGGGAQASSDMLLPHIRNSEMPRASNINSEFMKRGLERALAVPVLDRKLPAVGFRIIWPTMEKTESDKTEMWKSILSNRNMCDNMLANCGDVAFFVSCISGVISKRPGSVNLVSPAVGYWAVMRDGTDPTELLRWLQQQLQQIVAKMKLCPGVMGMGSTPEQIPSVVNSLCGILKDHNSGFIKRKMVAAQEHMVKPDHGKEVARLVGLAPDFNKLLWEAHYTLIESKISNDLFPAPDII